MVGVVASDGGRGWIVFASIILIAFLGQSSVGDEPMGYEQAMKEISHNELIKGWCVF